SRVCTVGMMRIVIIKTTQYHFPLVCFIITIGISKQNQIRALGKIYTFRCELKPYRHLQAIGKDRLFIGLTVAVGILKNKKLVVGFFISGLPVGVAGHCGYPQPPLIVEGYLYGISKIIKLLFGGKQLNFIARSHIEGFDRLLSV